MPNESPSTIRCPTCGADREPGFTACWNCGTALPSDGAEAAPAGAGGALDQDPAALAALLAVGARPLSADEEVPPEDPVAVRQYGEARRERELAALAYREAQAKAPWRAVALTTAPALEGHRVTRTVDIVTAECVYGMNLFRDFFASWTDLFGGRSRASQNVLRDARHVCLNELRQEAHGLGANAVIAVDLSYSEISGQGKNMLLLVASGTAVCVEPPPSPAPKAT